MGAACASQHQIIDVVVDSSALQTPPVADKCDENIKEDLNHLTVEAANGMVSELMNSSSGTNTKEQNLQQISGNTLTTNSEGSNIQGSQINPPQNQDLMSVPSASASDRAASGMITPLSDRETAAAAANKKTPTLTQILSGYDVNFTNLLTGKSGCPDRLFKLREFTVFFISNGSLEDVKEERCLLNKEVFPGLRAACQSRGYEFKVIDMAMGGLMEVDMREMHQLSLIERAKETSTSVFIIILLTNKLGPRTLPHHITGTDINKLKGLLDEHLGSQLTHLYSFAIPATLGTTQDEIVYRLVCNSSEEKEMFREIETRLADKTEAETLMKSAFHREVSWILDNQDHQLTIFAISRQFTSVSTDIVETNQQLLDQYFDPIGAGGGGDRDLEQLNFRLVNEIARDQFVRQRLEWTVGAGMSGGTVQHEEYLDGMRTRLVDFLTRQLHEKMKHCLVTEFTPPINKLQRSVATEVLTNSLIPTLPSLTKPIGLTITGTESQFLPPLENVQKFLHSNLLDRLDLIEPDGDNSGGQVVYITGPAGSGRTGCLRWIAAKVEPRTACSVVYRRVKGSPLASFLEGLITSLLEQLCCLTGQHVDNTFLNSIEELQNKLEEFLVSWPIEYQLIVMIDDVDCFQDSLDFLEKIKLASSCWIVLTSLEDFQFKISNTTKSCAVQLIEQSFHKDDQLLNHTLPNDYHSTQILKCLNLTMHILNLTNDKFENIESIFETLTTRLETLFNINFLKSVFSLLVSATRFYGISYTVLLIIIRKNIDSSHDNLITLSTKLCLLLHLIHPLLTCMRSANSQLLYLLCCDGLTNLVENRYEKNDQSLLINLCTSLKESHCFEYFPALVSHSSCTFYKNLDLATLSALFCNLHHTILTHNWKLKFCKNADATCDKTFEIFANIILDKQSLLWYSPEAFLAYLFQDCGKKLQTVVKSKHHKELTRLVKLSTSELSLVGDKCILLQPLKTTSCKKNEQQSYVDSIFTLPEKSWSGHVIVISTQNNSVIVWNLHTGKRVREWQDIPSPRDLRCITSVQVLIRCDRELRIYDLDAGVLIRRLKGVLNLKMPFFELMDTETMVALSRNRMYVEMMNITTGEMLATFKVGEDRFLNSLLVSTNGQYCVCGDESTKPFPLLVWDLRHRKLIHDIRIAGHHFDTSKSDITADGNYVICVTKELDDPAPNFLIIYDLSSGQMFRKLKPTFNTTCVAIHQTESFVVNGLVSGTIQVWDICAGSLSFNLEGHKFPPTKLELSKTNICLSCDETGNDRGIRLWNIDTGTSLGVYLAPCDVTSCRLIRQDLGVLIGLRGYENLVTVLLDSDAGFNTETDKDQIYGDPTKDGMTGLINNNY